MMFSRARFLSSERTTYQGAHAVSVAANIVVAGARIVVPAAIGLQVHRRELPDLAAVVDALLRAGASAPPG